MLVSVVMPLTTMAAPGVSPMVTIIMCHHFPRLSSHLLTLHPLRPDQTKHRDSVRLRQGYQLMLQINDQTQGWVYNDQQNDNTK